MNLFDTLQRNTYTSSEKILRDAIIKDPYYVASMSIESIMQEYHISRATIYRFLKKNGISRFAEMKGMILADVEEWNASNASFDFNYPVLDGISAQKIAENLQKDYTQTILSTKNLFDYHALRKAAEWIETSKQTDIYTSAGNICFADNFRFQLKEIGVHVNVPHELYEQMLCSAESDATHFAIVISFGGRNWQMKKICQILHENHTKLLLICSEQAEKLFSYADLRLYFSNYEDHADKISSFSTRISLLYILDALYTCFFERNYQENRKKKKQYYAKMSQAF